MRHFESIGFLDLKYAQRQLVQAAEAEYIAGRQDGDPHEDDYHAYFEFRSARDDLSMSPEDIAAASGPRARLAQRLADGDISAANFYLVDDIEGLQRRQYELRKEEERLNAMPWLQEAIEWVGNTALAVGLGLRVGKHSLTRQDISHETGLIEQRQQFYTQLRDHTLKQ